VADHTVEAQAGLIRALFPILFGPNALQLQALEMQRFRHNLAAFDTGNGPADF
jgi:hypothetical protein